MNESMTMMKATMKTLMAVLMLGGVLSIQPAVAGRFDGMPFSVQDRGYGGARGGYGGYGQDRRQYRDTRAAQPPPQYQRGERPRGQFTEEERRQFHRDLDKANRELYRGNRRRSMPAD
jgi:hypothetical protein